MRRSPVSRTRAGLVGVGSVALAMILAACGGSAGSGSSVPSDSAGATSSEASGPTGPTNPDDPTSPSDSTSSGGSGGLVVSLACRGVVLQATITTGSGRTAQLRLTNTGTSPCTVFGYADVRPAGSSGAPIAGAPRASQVPRPSAPTKVTLAAGGHAYAGLLVDSAGSCAAGVGAAVTPPVDGTPMRAQVVDGDGASARLSACRFSVGPLRATAAAAHI